jgi:hypothetical protein
MKKATTKKSTTKKAKNAVKKATPAMFLYTDDAWSLRYFDQNDLHFLEREVFG